MEVLRGLAGGGKMNRMEEETLAHRLGTTAHVSVLLKKAERLGYGTPDKLEDLARERGLRYYSDPAFKVNEEAGHYGIENELTNEELALSLLSVCFPYSQQRIRMGGAILAAEGNEPSSIARLARMERCDRVVHYIANLGNKVEPENSFWSELLELLPNFEMPPPDLLPHITRFVAMTGVTRNGRETVMQWVRPRARVGE